MLGFSEQDVCNTIDNLNNEKYCKVLEKMVSELSKKHGFMTQAYIMNFFDRYGEEILKPLTADVIAANNKKVEEDLKNLLSK